MAEDPYRAPIPAVVAGAGRLSQYMESVPRSVLSGRDEWRKQTFTRPDVARRGEMMLMAWCSPQSLIAYEWVAHDVEFAAACEHPGDLLRLRPHLAREIETAIRWNEELTEVGIPLDRPLGDEPVWPEEAAQRIRREA